MPFANKEMNMWPGAVQGHLTCASRWMEETLEIAQSREGATREHLANRGE